MNTFCFLFHRPFHGLFVDIRNKIPFYISDFTDCGSLQCLAATLYLYLVCLCSVVAFGGMLGKATDNYMVRSKKNDNHLTYVLIVNLGYNGMYSCCLY